jgi:ABC-type Fe3+-siderophore transport system permease subunit
MAGQPHTHDGRPLDNRQAELIAVNAFLTTFATFFAILRLVVVFRNKKKFMLADYFLMGAVVSAVCSFVYQKILCSRLSAPIVFQIH